MPVAVRGQGTLVAVGYPITALLVIALWINLHGVQMAASIPAAVVLVALTALAGRINLVVSPRMEICPAGFVTAAALIGGPLLGALAGLSLEAFTTGAVSKKRFTWGGAGALHGFAIGLIGQQLVLRGGSGALVLAALGLLAGLVINSINIVVVALDRPGNPRAQFAAAWRPRLLSWLLPWPPLAAFLFSYRSAAAVALSLAAGLLLAIELGNRLRLRLENRLAEERTRARRDALTGAPNRYALSEALTAEHARILRGGHPACVCFLEIDRFKAVNTDYGFFAADQLLIALYQRLRGRLRASDQVFRWGGDEFVLIAADQSDLREFAERLRLLIADEPFAIDELQLAVTVSVGAALLDETRTPEVVVEEASRLVQIAKEKRNAIEVESAEARNVTQAGPTALRTS